MITNDQFRSAIGPDLDRAKLPRYWDEYFTFQSTAPQLHRLARQALQVEIDQTAVKPGAFLDAQQAIARVLTNFGAQHNFHRQFNETFPTAKAAQTLGMQLYEMIAADPRWWVYSPTQHAGHAFPHATYFIPSGSPVYDRFVASRPDWQG